jgi:energy-coupling factor transporter ATP-binding protein EcfA2
LEEVAWRNAGQDAPLFERVSAAAQPGSAILLSGPNAAGKSTLLELIAGLRVPSAGRVSLAGAPAGTLPWAQRSRRVGLLPQRADLILCARTVAAELALPLRARGLAPSRIRAAVAVWLERLELTEAAGRFPHLLSRGERQRLALGTVLIAEPRLLLLDEPFAGQDPAQAFRLGALCREFLAGDPGRALIVATHDVEPAVAWTDARWHLEAGRMTVGAAGPVATPDMVGAAAASASERTARSHPALSRTRVAGGRP